MKSTTITIPYNGGTIRVTYTAEVSCPDLPPEDEAWLKMHTEEMFASAVIGTIELMATIKERVGLTPAAIDIMVGDGSSKKTVDITTLED